jgi:hypothetical protein
MVCDSDGRPVCAYCREEMRPDPNHTSYQQPAFVCDSCGVVELVPLHQKQGPPKGGTPAAA